MRRKKLYDVIVDQEFEIYEQDVIDDIIDKFNGKTISCDEVSKIKSYMAEMEADESYDYLLSHIIYYYMYK